MVDYVPFPDIAIIYQLIQIIYYNRKRTNSVFRELRKRVEIGQKPEYLTIFLCG